MKKILIFLGNPSTNSYSAKIADTYEDAARAANYDVDRVNISDLHFDPVLHDGYKEIQPLEPDLEVLQQKIDWADHIVLVYPNWWCSMPGVMKGMFDRMWLPGFAFNFDKHTHYLIRRLRGKTARVIIVIGTNTPFMTWWKFGDYTNEIVHGILGFAGITAKVTAFGPAERVSDTVREQWIERVRKLGERGI